jgi:fatty-acyl-CoA synthase
MGLIGFLLSPLTSQMSVDLLPTGAFVRRPLLWLDLISKNGGTISYSPTFGYELCARRGEWPIDAFDLSALAQRRPGRRHDPHAGPLRAFVERFAPAGFSDKAFVASYGMAEATLALSMAPLGTGLRTETLDVERLEREAVAVDRRRPAAAPALRPLRPGPARPRDGSPRRGGAVPCPSAASAASMCAAPA